MGGLKKLSWGFVYLGMVAVCILVALEHEILLNVFQIIAISLISIAGTEFVYWVSGAYNDDEQ